MTTNRTQQKKILIVTGIYPPDIGGPATYLAQFIPFLRSAGHEVSVVTFGSNITVSRTVEDGVRVYRIPRTWSRWSRLMHYYRAVHALAKDSDMLYVHDMSIAGLVAYLVHLRTGLPYLTRIGGDFLWEQAFQKAHTTLSYTDFQGREPLWYRVRRALSSYILRRARAVIVPSEFLRSVVLLWGLAPAQVRVVPNAIEELSMDADLANPTLTHMERVKSEGKKVVVACGRFVNWKHFDVLIEASRALPDVHVYLIGEGPEESHYRTLSAQYRLDDRVSIVSAQSRTLLAQLLRRADCYVLPSEGDTFSFVSLEALYAGTPLILVREAALPEIFGAYEGRGVTFASRTALALTDALRSPQTYVRPADAVQDEVQERFSIGGHFEAVHAIVQEI